MTTLASRPQQDKDSEPAMVTPEQARDDPSVAGSEPATETIELMVGLLTLNNAGTIESLVKSIVEEVRQSFPNVSAVLVNCDAGSQDGTPALIERIAAGMIPVRTVPNAASTYANLTRESGFPGRDESIRNLCLTARQLRRMRLIN